VATSTALPVPSAVLHFESALLPDGWADDVRLHVAGGAFVRIERGVPREPGDECAALGLPGLPNLHSHAFQRALAGLSEARGHTQDSFWTWRELMYRFVAQLTPEAVEAITAQAYVEMLEAGFTRVGEFHYLHHGADGRPYADPAELTARIAAAAEQAGLGLSLLQVFYAHSGFGAAPPQPQQRRFVHDLDSYTRLLERSREILGRLDHARLGVAPHSLRAVTPEELAQVCALAGAAPIHLHIAEQQREVDECLAWSGRRPIAWLLDAQPLDARFCLVHATHASEDELARLGRSGAVVGLCPITEANLGDGTFAAHEFAAAGGDYGVGSDSNVLISATEELRLLEYGQRLKQRARNLLASTEHLHTGRALFERAVRGGARALGVPPGFQPGAPADAVALDLEHPQFAARTRDSLLDSWIFSAGPGCIDRVWCRGTRVVERGRHVRRSQIAARYRATLEALLRA